MSAQTTVTIMELLEQGIKLFDESYPIFDESYRPILEKQIIDYYYFKEIGTSLPAKFRFWLNQKMRLIMPYYNEMYKTTKLDMEILDNYRIKETYTRDVTDNNVLTLNTTQSEIANNGRIAKISDTPMSRIDLSDNSHISNLEDDKTTIDSDITNTGTNTTDNTNHETWIREMNGSIGIATDAQHVMEYRRALINVDMMIIEELEELFMGVLG